MILWISLDIENSVTDTKITEKQLIWMCFDISRLNTNSLALSGGMW